MRFEKEFWCVEKDPVCGDDVVVQVGEVENVCSTCRPVLGQNLSPGTLFLFLGTNFSKDKLK